eukprot:CAMPEP_0175984320 /NCGR_PEP_ID=MMETSP0108-20121206/48951_1 /TAXON_ID=195067 ORGANISM="Goniomonas pacifica, Strain CCMP1869" /NCGR_SAMPLE_ID=MMETSP0108 /ASSEMBLY_ACC=CAM_ASM_000204 /LENGTH=141 /DNA_ID=CAMNT_0017315199 /DNA_START=114 /DNA_END=539 /DNA_ORIENTATION=+
MWCLRVVSARVSVSVSLCCVCATYVGEGLSREALGDPGGGVQRDDGDSRFVLALPGGDLGVDVEEGGEVVQNSDEKFADHGGVELHRHGRWAGRCSSLEVVVHRQDRGAAQVDGDHGGGEVEYQREQCVATVAQSKEEEVD